jgi:CubicO group peptidase (beta-lactamase class C family)
MDPIGASSSWRWYGYDNSWVNVDGQWVQSVSGGGHSGGGLFISTEDHARFGLLHLAGGQWQDQRILSDRWIQDATSPSKTNVNYGYMWWLNQKGPRHWEGVPENAYYAAGFGGNFIVVLPDQELVVVVRWLEPSKMASFMSLLMKAL